MSNKKKYKKYIFQPSNIFDGSMDKKTKTTIFVTGFGFTLYFSYLLGGSWSHGDTIIDAFNNMNHFVFEQHHYLVGITEKTPIYIGVCESIYIFAMALFLTKYHYGYAGREYGNAQLGKAEYFTLACADDDKNNLVKVNFGNTPHKEDVYVNTKNYWIAQNVYFSIYCKYIHNLHMLVIGPSGSGKTFRFVKPILSCLLNNFLVTDPKGELYKQTGQFMKDNGYNVKVISIQSEELMSVCTRFNPFNYLTCESDILMLVEILFRATTPPDANNSQPFFEDMAQVVLTDIFYLMYYTYPKEKQNWYSFVELLESTVIEMTPNRTIDKSNPNILYNRFKRANEEWHKGTYTNGKSQKEDLKGWVDINKLYNMAQETASSVTATLDSHCKFMKLDCVKKLLSEDEIDIINTFGYGRNSSEDAYGSQKTILYIATSENIKHYNWILSMIYSLFFNKLYDLTDTDQSIHETLPIPLTFLMDEFANTFVPDTIVDLLTTMRSRGMNIIAIIQTLSQLKTLFPKDKKDETFAGNMTTTVILGGPENPDECKKISEHFYDKTIGKKTTGTSNSSNASVSHNSDVMKKELISPADIHNLDENMVIIGFSGGLKPLYTPKIDLANSPIYPCLVRGSKYSSEPPFIPNFDADRVTLNDGKTVIYSEENYTAGKEAFKKAKKDIIKLSIDELPLFIYAAERDAVDLHQFDINDLKEYAAATILEESIKDTNLRELSSSQFLVASRLKNAGFDNEQIGALTPLIKAGMDYNEIITYFKIEDSVNKVTEFVLKFLQSRKDFKK